MNLEIVAIHGRGSAVDEYVQLRVLAKTDLRYYAIADTTYVTPDRISNRLRHFYWFIDWPVNQGDVVFLDTKAGLNKSYISDDGITVHQLYWGLSSAVWNDTGDAAVLLYTADWSTFQTS